MVEVPSVTLNNGLTMPMPGLGTWQAKPGEVEEAVKVAIDLGYRHIDGAMIYLNEAEVGAAIKEKISDGTVKREDLFVVNKLWNTFHATAAVVPSCLRTLKNMGLDYLDLYLIHWPFAFQESGDIYFPRDARGMNIFSDEDYLNTWKGMEECVKLGLVKSIGVSNFNLRQLQRLLDAATIRPVTNQVECHPYLNQKEMISWCAARGIVITAYAPLGSPARPWARRSDPILLEDRRVLDIAKKVGKTPAQVVLNYLMRLGVVPIPKSINPERMRENLNVFDFQLSNEDMHVMDSLNCNDRLCLFNDAKAHKYYPFNE